MSDRFDRSPSAVGNAESDDAKRKLVLVLVGLGVAVAAWFIGAAVIPRWWAHRAANMSGGGLVRGSFFGVTIGFVFTILPLAILRFGWRIRARIREGGFRRALIVVAVAVLAAFPNLATLGIVAGRGGGAERGRDILSANGTGFLGGTLVGVILALVAAVVSTYILWSRRGSREEAKRLKRQGKDAPG